MAKIINIANLSDNEIRELLDVTLKKEEIENARRIDSYKPHDGAWRGKPDDGQMAFHKSGAKVRLLLGGNQSGKTTAGLIEAIWTALGIHPYRKIKVPNKGRIVASLGFEEGAGNNIVPKLEEWLPHGCLRKKPKLNQAGIPALYEFTNGSSFNILSGDQEDKVFEGWTGDWVWIDEPCRRHIYDASRRGLMRANGCIWFTLTPLSEPWLYNDLYEPAISKTRNDIGVFIIDSYDNATSHGGCIPDESIKAREDELPEEYKKVRIHGQFLHLTGRIYPQFDTKIHVVPQFDVPRDWEVWDGFDLHLQKEHAYCQWAISPENQIFVCNEIYEKLTVSELAKKALEMRKGKKMGRTLIDTSAETPDSISRLAPRRILSAMGIYTTLPHKDSNVIPGINAMRELLTLKKMNDNTMKPQFFVMSHCKRHIKEFNNYVQDNRDTEFNIKDKPRKTFDDMMDLDRYFVITHPLTKGLVESFRYSDFKYGHQFDDGYDPIEEERQKEIYRKSSSLNRFFNERSAHERRIQGY